MNRRFRLFRVRMCKPKTQTNIQYKLKRNIKQQNKLDLEHSSTYIQNVRFNSKKIHVHIYKMGDKNTLLFVSTLILNFKM